MLQTRNLFFFRCAVSVDLFGVTSDPAGDCLPRSGGTTWVPLTNPIELGDAAKGFDAEKAQDDIRRQGCHWFTSEGPIDVFWGDAGPPRAA
jgi:hypothetical protein